MHTGENEQALRKILDMTRLMGLVILGLHFYYYCYGAFVGWGLQSPFTDRLLTGMERSGLFSDFQKSKWISLSFLLISLLGAKGRKDEKLQPRTAFAYITTGLALYFLSYLCIQLPLPAPDLTMLYGAVTIIGYLLVLTGGTLLSRIIKRGLNQNDVFNREAETFPQEERLLQNEYSINLPACYRLKNKVRKSWINIINPFRGILVLGTPGSGKSYFVIRHVITQHIQ